MLNKLFTVRPEEIFEHPESYPIDPRSIPEGLIEGWEVYGPAHYSRDGLHVKYNSLPIIVKPDWKDYRDIVLYIEINDSKFWYLKPPNTCGNKPVWFQSMQTLRFIRKYYD